MKMGKLNLPMYANGGIIDIDCALLPTAVPWFSLFTNNLPPIGVSLKSTYDANSASL